MTDMATIRQTTELAPQYDNMLAEIGRMDNEVRALAAHHGKSHSQFQYAMLDNAGPIAGPTKIRNLRQVLAVTERTRDALEESTFKVREHRARANMLRHRAESANGSAELLQIKADQADSTATRIEKNMAGAVRKLAAYYAQVESLTNEIRKELGKSDDEPITESDFETDEERFHIMKAFEQALVAARSNGLRIDHGNLIYMHDIGISGRLAQEDIVNYIGREDEYRRLHPDAVHEMHAMELQFLHDMAEKYKGCSQAYAAAKGLIPISSIALLGE